jgi:hypothetical protein
VFVYAWFFPVLYYFLAYIPYNFLKNFGITFTCYLRGVAATVSILNEFVFDVVVGVALFFRFFIQGIRLGLIFLIYYAFHELFMENMLYHYSTYSNESFLNDLMGVELNFSSFIFFILVKIPF